MKVVKRIPVAACKPRRHPMDLLEGVIGDLACFGITSTPSFVSQNHLTHFIYHVSHLAHHNFEPLKSLISSSNLSNAWPQGSPLSLIHLFKAAFCSSAFSCACVTCSIACSIALVKIGHLFQHILFHHGLCACPCLME